MSDVFAGFDREEIRGVPVLWREDHRFKTIRLTLAARRPLDDRAAARSVLPGLLLHGTAKDRNRPALARRMEQLYGAGVVPATRKLGESHVLRLTLDAVAGSHLPGRPDQLRDGLSFLGDYLAQPRLEDGGFPKDTFARERRQAIDAARALIDDRSSYANQQAVVHACAGEPMAIIENGGIEALQALDREAPERARMDFLQAGQMWLVAMGALSGDRFRGEVERFLGELPERAPQAIPPPVEVEARPSRRVVERVDLQQSKLVSVLRTAPTDDVETLIGRRFYVSMLGGGPHSRLFRDLREKQSLAYYAGAGLDRHKGLLIVQVGLDEAAAERAEAEILRQVDELAAGNFEDSELEIARAGFLSQLLAVDDSTAARCEFTSQQWVLGVDRNPAQLGELYRSADRDCVARGAAGTWFDLSFLLAPRNGASPGEGEGEGQGEGEQGGGR